MSKTTRRWQSQAIKFNNEIITTILPSSDQLEHMDLIDLQSLSNNLRSTQETLNEFQSIIASTWLNAQEWYKETRQS
jgi:molecular chaperone GrpE (heat shock protein)